MPLTFFALPVKWLGPNRIRPLAVDGKGSKEKVTADMKQWGSAQGRMVVNPGK
jgi:DNA repair and recombination RAD54-like protein